MTARKKSKCKNKQSTIQSSNYNVGSASHNTAWDVVEMQHLWHNGDRSEKYIRLDPQQLRNNKKTHANYEINTDAVFSHSNSYQMHRAVNNAA